MDDNQRAIYKGQLFVIALITVVVLLLWGAQLVGRSVACRFIWTRDATDAEMEPVIEYLHRHASTVQDVKDMVHFWKESHAKFPRIRITTCSDGLDAHHFKLSGNTIVISRGIWETQTSSGTALKALALFAEFQHTPLGNSHPDKQATQDKLIEVRKCFPRADREDPLVRSVVHKGTANHD